MPAVAAAPAAADFRHNAVFGDGEPKAPRKPSAVRVHEGNFVDRMMPSGAAPSVPKAGQVATKPLDHGTVHDTLRAAQKAAAWPVDTYAQLCAAIDACPDALEATIAAFSLPNTATYEFVRESWRKRMADDADLQAEFARLLAHYRNRS